MIGAEIDHWVLNQKTLIPANAFGDNWDWESGVGIEFTNTAWAELFVAGEAVGGSGFEHAIGAGTLDPACRLTAKCLT